MPHIIIACVLPLRVLYPTPTPPPLLPNQSPLPHGSDGSGGILRGRGPRGPAPPPTRSAPRHLSHLGSGLPAGRGKPRTPCDSSHTRFIWRYSLIDLKLCTFESLVAPNQPYSDVPHLQTDKWGKRAFLTLQLNQAKIQVVISTTKQLVEDSRSFRNFN